VNKIGANGAESIAEALKVNTSLQQIDLSEDIDAKLREQINTLLRDQPKRLIACKTWTYILYCALRVLLPKDICKYIVSKQKRWMMNDERFKQLC
jgi:hypothetical protein